MRRYAISYRRSVTVRAVFEEGKRILGTVVHVLAIQVNHGTVAGDLYSTCTE